VKQLTSVVHLMFGIALLAIGAFFLRGFLGAGKASFQQSTTTNSRKSLSPEPDLGGASGRVYGVLAQLEKTKDDESDGDKEEPMSAAGGASPSSFERVAPTPTDRPNHFLHRRLSLETCQIFEFDVPPHALRPELRGTFRSVGAGAASVELRLLNEEEFASFANNAPGSATFQEQASNHGQIHWALEPTLGYPRKYYLTIRNSSARNVAVIDADFTASFE